MTTALITHLDCDNHVTPAGHPEQVARLEYVREALSAAEFDDVQRIDAPLGTEVQVALAHPAEYIQAIRNASPQTGSVALDPDTHMSPGSYQAAMRCVGAVCEAVDLVLDGKIKNAFCATRPPGHHAEKTRPMGFGFFNQIAIGAKYALEEKGLERVAIVDFDVHHGNGSQDISWDDERMLYASTHQMPLYPGSGAASETGAHGNVLNHPLDPHSDGAMLMQALEREIIPALKDHKPEILFISAGFDAHMADPLANLNFATEDFGKATDVLCRFAMDHCDGRVISTLEGGYDLDALAASAAAHLRVLSEYS